MAARDRAPPLLAVLARPTGAAEALAAHAHAARDRIARREAGRSAAVRVARALGAVGAAPAVGAGAVAAVRGVRLQKPWPLQFAAAGARRRGARGAAAPPGQADAREGARVVVAPAELLDAPAASLGVGARRRALARRARPSPRALARAARLRAVAATRAAVGAAAPLAADAFEARVARALEGGGVALAAAAAVEWAAATRAVSARVAGRAGALAVDAAPLARAAVGARDFVAGGSGPVAQALAAATAHVAHAAREAAAHERRLPRGVRADLDIAQLPAPASRADAACADAPAAALGRTTAAQLAHAVLRRRAVLPRPPRLARAPPGREAGAVRRVAPLADGRAAVGAAPAEGQRQLMGSPCAPGSVAAHVECASMGEMSR